jgi:autotransporter-associated beta strand protein
VFEADAEVSGDVKLIDETRVLVSGTETRGKISGVVFGDRLSVYRGEGTLVLSGENTYPGGTLVRGSTLALGCAGSAGTGSITLDNGTLAFENGEAVTFMNDISGVGTIALTGTAPVLFRCDMSALSASLDLCGTWQTFTEMPPFSKIVNSHSGRATFALASNLGTVSWPGYALEGKVSLAIGEGTILDLGGREIEVFRLEPGAASKIVNGTVKQIKPMVGMRVIFR